MNAEVVIDLAQEAIRVTLLLGGPIMIVALVVGLIISLFQALTQIQEMTLTFVPKILIVFVTMIFVLPFMLRTLTDFTLGLFDRIIALGV